MVCCSLNKRIDITLQVLEVGYAPYNFGEKGIISEHYQTTTMHWHFSKAINIVKTRIGPNTEPCGTPDVTLTVAEYAPDTTTCCFLLYR